MILVNDAPADTPLVVLLHGYGADERDLVGLVPYLPQEFRYVSLRAPERVPGMPGYQWFDLEFETGPDGPELATSPAAIAAVSAGASAAAATIWSELADVPAERRAVVGFSQGAIAGMQAWRERPDGFVCGAILSGFVAPDPHANDEVFAKRRPPVFWGRGLRDAVIPPAAIETVGPWLASHASAEVVELPEAGHEITLAELQRLSTFLRANLGTGDTSGANS